MRTKIKKTLYVPHTKVCGLFSGFLDDPKLKTLKLRPHSKKCGFKFMDIKTLNRSPNKNKRAQQETVGFVFIMLIVMILGVILLGISLRNQNKDVFVEDAEISNFLSASLSYTSECYKDYDSDFKTLSDLTKYCYSPAQITCPDGKTSCEMLKETYSEMLGSYKPAGILKYSLMKFTYNSSLINTKFLEIDTREGSPVCNNKRAGRQEISSGEGKIIIELEVCLKS